MRYVRFIGGVALLVCLGFAGYGALHDVKGWGWFLFLTVLFAIALVEKETK